MQEPTRLLIKLDADLLDLTLPQIQSQGFVTGVHPGEPQTTLVVELGPRFGSVKAADAPLDPDGTRITLDLFPVPEVHVGPGAHGHPAHPRAPVAPAPHPFAPAVQTIVIDPGHGGDETGAHGARARSRRRSRSAWRDG